MSRPLTAGDPPPAKSPALATRVLVAATTGFLLAAPVTGSVALRLACLALAAGALIALSRRERLLAPGILPSGLVAAFAAWVLLAAASTAWSVRPAYTLSELRPELAYPVITFAVFFLAASEPSRWRVWRDALLAGAAALFLAEFARESLGSGNTRTWYGGPGSYSTHLALLAPLVLALAWPRPWGAGRGTGALAAAFLVLFAAAWFTGNRIVWAAFFVSIAVAALAWRRAGGLASSAPRRAWRLAVPAAIAILVFFAASVAERSERLWPGRSDLAASVTGDLRPRLWAVGLAKLGERPVLGHGFGREILAEAFLPETPGNGHPPVTHAHNTFIDVALQLGLAGLAVFLWVLAALAREYLALLRQGATAGAGALGLAILAGYFTKNLTDDFLYRHNALVFWALNGMLLGLARRMGSERA